ncbi:pyruvate dehydrogenase E2 component (dihydrolipoamide acetyltransferase) [Thermoanaerobacter thermohydrosulfuricus]|uniref:Dihydrolipoamide acetyltransferase component of pyruvate dehydrogenase complex n=4 Tax=Thermoanaerobacter TaxID=1754 RepID=B0K8I7_THEP3|nr:MULTISPECIES: dihydrolipoamide acetyltransferase family protein [Thermoanaerobacter]ABY94450.1 catalytic domain of components of various dehydrogenase complexes [Thermoanaerobacter pseudethanolicus ATCC 33223]ADV79403.1 catalytic domain-containing protein of components of various dehydrogenase complexes [Thermoanaerobacter brockii subsp. finnii Ako-1]EMT38591.1 Pyruvate/2-oxoglutarate dehydrogenase complex, dihydrolipoamide acyltransferase (E2) component [Thermoanaerobacter thermohydrosulfuri
MPVNVVMPKLGLTMKEGRVDRWLKKVGDIVKKGEEIVEVSTDKITNVVESPADGILAKILVNEGEIVPVATPIGIITAEGEKLEEVEKSEEKFIKATPVAKRLAKENNIDLSLITGTGPGGRITEEDVKKFISEQKVKTEEEGPKKEVAVIEGQALEKVERMPMDNIRKTISQRMKKSWSEIPHVTEDIKVDVTELVNLRENLNHISDNKFTYTDLIAKACVIAIKKNPVVNWSIEGEYIIKNSSINLGIAVALDNGLIVPVVKEADKKSLLELSKNIKELSERARNNKLTPDEIIGSTFTITNLGMYEIDSFTPIINPPESAILGVNKIYKEPVVLDDNIVIRHIIKLSLSFDHRLIDGATAAKFLLDLKKTLENPLSLLI